MSITKSIDDKKKKKQRTTMPSTKSSTMSSTKLSMNDKKKKKQRTTMSFTKSSTKSSMNDKKKKKKKRTMKSTKSSNKSSMNDKKKKKKKHITFTTSSPSSLINQYSITKDIMKNGICNRTKNIDFNDIDVSDRTIYWGLGVEHEMQLFHKASSGMKNTNIMFNSQESTCFLTNEHDSCCKTKPINKCNDFTNEVKIYNNKHKTNNQKTDFGLTNEEKLFIENTQWELSGRQIKGCGKGKEEITTLSKRVPILMPELITTNFSNRTIDSIWKEMIKLESHYIAIQMKNPHTKQKVKKYGPLCTHLCGASSEILIPEEPTFKSNEYIFKQAPLTDYLGSFHITITLPHTKDILTKDFVKMHQNMAQQIQWLEPLMMTAFFSPTQKAVGNKYEPEGSFRVMTIGWGNFGGSNVRRMGTKGLDRGSNIKSLWRRGLKFEGTKKLNKCAEISPPQYKKSKSIHTGDFRTFGQELNLEKCKQLYNPNDCINGRADGAPMKPPFGMEIRIFDHFPSEYLLELMRIVVLIGCNSQRHPAKDYVYRDKRWIKAVQNIMHDGWNAELDSKFITALRTNLGLPINTSSILAYDIFKQLVHELHDVNKDAYFNKIMNETPNIEPVVPQINRMCWEMAFTQKFNVKVINFLKETFHSEQVVSINDFTKMFKKSETLEFKNWENDMNDLLYALETNNHVHLELFNGKIKNVKVLL